MKTQGNSLSPLRRLAASLGALLLASTPLLAADVVTDGDMELAGTTNWTHVDLQGANAPSSKATDQSASGQSLKATAQAGDRVPREWANVQSSVGTIGPSDTVTLSLWYGRQHFIDTKAGAGVTLHVEAAAAGSGSWFSVWSSALLVASTTFSSTTVTNQNVSASFTAAAQDYDLRLRAVGNTGKDAAATFSVWWDDVVLDVAGAVATTTVGDGTNPGNSSPCPGDAAVELDSFTLQTSSGNDTVTAVEVTLSGGSAAALSVVEITNDAGGLVHGSVPNPGADTVNVPLTINITANAVSTQYKVRVTPKSHAAMAVGSFSVTGTVTAITSANTKNYNDTGSATVSIDNQPPGDATWGTVTPGDNQVDLNWTNPGGDFVEVTIVRDTSPIGDAPDEGGTYTGVGTVVYTGALQTFTDNTAVNGNTYYYKIFARDGCNNWSAGVQTGPHTPQPPASTTVGDGTDPGNASPCPGDAAVELDAFTLQTSVSTDTVTAVEVTFAAGTAAALALVEITDDGGGTVYGSVAAPAGDVVNVSLSSNITATTTLTQYKVRVTPKSHAAMGAGDFSVTGTVTALTSSNPKTLNDAASATVTIDNNAPGDATWGTVTPGDGQVVLNWTNPVDADFVEVTIVRDTSPIGDAPDEGGTYTGVGTVVYTGGLQTFTDTTVINGVDYHYKIFARDGCNNWSPGAATGPHQPVGPVTITLDGGCKDASDPGQWTWGAAADLGDMSDATFASSVTNNDILRACVADDAAYNCKQIDNVRVFVRSAEPTGANDQIDYGLYDGASDFYTGAPLVPGTAFGDSFTDYPTRPWGGSWTFTDVDNLVVPVQYQRVNPGADEIRVAEVWADVTYDPSVDVCGVTTTVGDGVDPANASACPSTTAILDAFTLATDSATDTVTAVQVTLAGAADIWTRVATVEIVSDDEATVYGTATPASNTVNLSLAPTIPVNTTPTQYKVRVTAESHASLGGAAYPVTGTVTDVTVTGGKSVGDTGSATVTIDDAPTGDAAWGVITPGDQQIELNWVNPVDADFVEVLIVRHTATIPNVPNEGGTYTGVGTVVFTGNLTTFTDTLLTNGQPYFYKVFARDGCSNWSPGVETGPHTPTAGATPTTTVTDGTDPAAGTVCPGTSAFLDSFILQTDTGAATVSSVRVTLGGTANARNELTNVEITDDGGTPLGNTAAPYATDDVDVSVSIPVTTTLTQYRVRITTEGHATMTVATFSLTGAVTDVTVTDTLGSVTDDSNVQTLDNVPPGDAAWGTVTPGPGQVALSWTNPATDFAEVMILRAQSSIADAPDEGGGYSGTATVVYTGALESFTDFGVSNPNSYFYKIFARDGCSSWSAGAETGPHTPDPAAELRVTPGAATSAVAGGCDQVTISVTHVNDDDGDSTTTFERSPSGLNSWSTICSNVGGGSPRQCVDTTVAESTTYDYRTRFFDPDGVLGAQPADTSATTPACADNDTTVQSNSATGTTCSTITTTSTFTGDQNGNGWVRVQVDGATKCARVVGSSPRQCIASGVAPGNHNVTFTFSDPDGVVAPSPPPNPETLVGINVPACNGADDRPPTVLVLVPAREATLGGDTNTVKIQVFEDTALRAASPVEVSVDGGVWSTTAAINPNYTCGDGVTCKIWEWNLDTTALANGVHALTIQVWDEQSNRALLSQPFVVNNSGGGVAQGDGFLLRRTRGSQLCIDCHDLPTHSSQTTDSGYGNWAIDCLTCHTPHLTTNVFLIREQIRTPNSGLKAVSLQAHATGTDYVLNGPYGGDNVCITCGVCEVCHTQTANHQNNNLASNHGHNTDTKCMSCHGHDKGFAGSGCNGCHNAPPTIGKHGTHDQVWDSTEGNTASSYAETAPHATAAQYGFACAKCHSGTHDGQMVAPADKVVDVSFDDTADPRNPLPAAYAADAAKFFDDGVTIGDNIRWQWSDGTCSNLYCHSRAVPLGGTDFFSTPTWNQGGSLDCTGCHDTAGASTLLSPPHQIHTGPYGLGCVRCHDATVLDNATIADKRQHVDGQKDIQFDTTVPDNSGGSWSGSPGYTCGGVYCHSQGTAAAAPYPAPNTVLSWNGGNSDCRSCHGNDATAAPTMSSQKHPSHVNNVAVIGSNYDCITCHAATVSDNSTIDNFANHVNGSPTLSIPLGGTWSDPTCTNTYCHSSGQSGVLDYKTPDWSSAVDLDCKGCHGSHPENAFASVAGEPNYSTEPNSHGVHVTAASDCSRCHNDTTSTGTAILAGSTLHTNQSIDVAIAPAYDRNGGTKFDNYTGSPGGTCSSVYCHSNGEPVTGTQLSWTTPNWGGALETDCTGCHGNDGQAPAELIGDSGSTLEGSLAHVKHVGTYGFACDDCHDLTVESRANNRLLRSGQTTHANQAKNVDFTTWPVNQTGGSWAAASHTCANTYCHSDGQSVSAPFNAPLVTPDWDSGMTTNCRSCHANDASAAPTMSSGKHTNHVNNAALLGVEFGCITCHDATVSDNTTISTIANHVNGTADVSMSTGTWSDPTCSNSYCHSSGQNDVTPEFYSPNWTSTSLDCEGCHGRHSDNAFASVAGEPNYTNGGAGAATANSHSKHVSVATDCSSCHNATVATSNQIDGSDPAQHIDNAPDVVIAAVWDTNGATSNFDAGTKTCNSIACHGGGTPQWGSGALACRSCHGVGTGLATKDDVDDYVYGNATTALVDLDEWTAFGHGAAASYAESGNGGADFDAGGDGCFYCHSSGVNHNDAANPFRLAYAATPSTAAQKDELCTRCHGGGGYDPDGGGGLPAIDSGLDIDRYHSGTDHAARGGGGNDGGMFCWDCHDPHGDYNHSVGPKQNLAYMIQEKPMQDHAAAAGWGVGTEAPMTPDFRNDRDGTGGFDWLDYVVDDGVGTRGVCQVCHTATSRFTNGNGTYDSGHNSSQGACTTCHLHDDADYAEYEAFKPQGGGGCLGCHELTGQGARRAVGADFGKTSHHVGNGGATMGGTLTDADCVVCHAEGTMVFNSGSGLWEPATNESPVKLHGGTGGDTTINLRNVDTGGHFFYDKSVISGGVANWSSDGDPDWATQTSTNLDPFCLGCHDGDGASDVDGGALGELGAVPLNPFNDAAITNENDQFDRGRVTDIASRVAATWSSGPGGSGAYSAQDRDTAPRGADGVDDPPEGIFSRHAIRGQAASTYDTAPLTNGQGIPAAYWVGSWNDTSVMGCADCHTVDGANDVDGNAHGSNSEYLLKDASGTATEGTLGGLNYICHKCHDPGKYQGGVGHTSKSADWADTTADSGGTRISGDGNVYGFACTNCHGGVVDTGGVPEFGTIHGTSQVFDVWGEPTRNNHQKVGERNAYRFMNGNSLRYYQPDQDHAAPWDWGGTGITCYTIDDPEIDSFGGCSQHGGADATFTKPVQRPLKY